ncbi:SusC/RagA family TonB-linked outer membrane protein [Pedobacter paludis]|nr:SusC/RagA family TonB-linked outer membrane protein [Pedobacter paludis]
MKYFIYSSWLGNQLRHGVMKTFIVMKLSLLITVIAVLNVKAAANAQNISINVKNQTIQEICKEIEKQSGYTFWYSDELNLQKKLSITLNHSTLTDALDACLKKQGFDYQLIDKTILLKKKEESIIDKVKNLFKRINITGRITDEQGNAIPGVNVTVKGTNAITTTDNAGKYNIEADENAILVFTYVGYEIQETPVNNRKTINIRLKASDNQLDQVQVIGYGTTTRRLSTSNIGSVKAEQIARQPVSNPLLALQGKVPGLSVTQTSGFAGANVDVTIQGLNSLRKGNDAFYVIDGVPYSPQQISTPVTPTYYPGSSTAGAPTGGSALNFINPADIESIEILKDADATAIYGSKAANGAILITTKKGKIGRMKVDLNMQSGIGEVAKEIKLLGTEDYLKIRRAALANDGTAIGATDYDLNGTWDQNTQHNWQKELIGNTASFTNLQASISGGTENVQYLIGGGYLRDGSVMSSKFNDTKGNAHFNLNVKSPNQKIGANLTVSYLQDLNKMPTADFTGSSYILLAPNSPQLYNEDGSINWAPLPGNPNSSTFSNPIAALDRSYIFRTTNIISNAGIFYNIIPGLVLKANIGYNRLQSQEDLLNPQSSYSPSITTNLRSHNYANKYVNSYIVEPQLTYNRNTKIGHFEFLLGGSLQQSDNNLKAFNASGFATDGQLENMQAASTITASAALQSRYRYSGIFGRVNYRLKDRYILNISARRDGSSRFGPENLFNNFYALGGAWIFSEESFLKESLGFINFGKLRISYGTTGNDQIGDYQFLNLYNNYTSGIGVPYQSTVGLLPTGHSNPYLQWEDTNKLNIGIDLGFLKNRILFNLNYFRNRSANQLLPQPLPAYTGFASVTSNLPAVVQNTGLEMTLEASPIKGKSFRWETSLVLTIPKNKLASFPGLEQSTLASQYVVGQPINVLQRYNYAGVNPQTGLYEFWKADGTLTTSPVALTDRTVLVDLNPQYYGGFNNNVTYKSLSLDFTFQFVKQLGETFKYGFGGPGRINNNAPVNYLNYWKAPGDQAEFQRPSLTSISSTAYSNLRNSNAIYDDASFIRLKNVSLSYSLPQSFLKRIKIPNAAVFLQGQNLLTITGYQGRDPESRSTLGLPPLRVYTIGIQLSL